MPTTVAKFEPDRFTFQVGGLRTKDNAIKHKIDLQKRGYSPYIQKTYNEQSKEVWYSVRIGYYDSIDIAAEAAATFTTNEQIPAKAAIVTK